MSKQAYRVDVHSPSLWYRNLSQKTSRVIAAKDDLPAKAASNLLNENRGRPDEGDIRHAPGVPLLFKEMVHPLHFPPALGIAGVDVEQTCQAAERRVRVLAAKGGLMLIE